MRIFFINAILQKFGRAQVFENPKREIFIYTVYTPVEDGIHQCISFFKACAHRYLWYGPGKNYHLLVGTCRSMEKDLKVSGDRFNPCHDKNAAGGLLLFSNVYFYMIVIIAVSVILYFTQINFMVITVMERKMKKTMRRVHKTSQLQGFQMSLTFFGKGPHIIV